MHSNAIIHIVKVYITVDRHRDSIKLRSNDFEFKNKVYSD